MKKRTTSGSPTRAEQFAQSFATEADLRIALITLLERMPSNRNIRHTHGASEHGKDIVFERETAFGRTELIACVVKNAAITGSADSDQGARTVYHQAELCLDTSILNAQGLKESVAQVFVISPYPCTDQALSSIEGKLTKSSRVLFMVGSELFDLFEKHYPDYLLFKSGLFASYVSDLEAGIDGDNAVANVLIRHGIGGTAERATQIYVEPKLRVNITNFNLPIAEPKADRLRDVFTEHDVVNYNSTLRHVVRAVGLWSTIPSNDKEIAALSTKIRNQWQRSYESHIRSASAQGRTIPSKKGLKLRLVNNTVLVSEFENATAPAFKELKALRTCIEKANTLVASNPSTLDSFLAHPECLTFSYVSGLASRTSGLITSFGTSSSTECFGRSLLDSLVDCVIVAPAGFGKSSFCNNNALTDLQLLKEQQSNVVPILIKLHGLASKRPRNYKAAFLQSEGVQKLWDSRNEDGRKRVFRIYLDGLDEIPIETEQISIMHLASELKKDAPETQIIVTCREHVAGSHLQAFVRMNLAEMDDAMCRHFVESWLLDDLSKVELFYEQITRVPALKYMIKVPLLATLILSVFSSTGTIPESRIRIYDMFVSLMAGGWDIAKNVQRGTLFGPQPKITVLQALAWKLQIGNKRDATEFEFNEAVRTQLPSMYAQGSVLLREILQDGLLVQAGTSIAFSHLSFQEYLAAKDLLEPTGRKVTTAITAFLKGETWWNDVLLFYVSLCAQPHAVEDFVRDNVKRIASRSFDPQIVARARFLLSEIAVAYPGSSPNFDFPGLAGVFAR